jgi:hypothetical protein
MFVSYQEVKEISSLSPITIVTKMSPVVDCFSADGAISHREVIYAIARDEALVTALEDILPKDW